MSDIKIHDIDMQLAMDVCQHVLIHGRLIDGYYSADLVGIPLSHAYENGTEITGIYDNLPRKPRQLSLINVAVARPAVHKVSRLLQSDSWILIIEHKRTENILYGTRNHANRNCDGMLMWGENPVKYLRHSFEGDVELFQKQMFYLKLAIDIC